jgi:hypothetical protein
MRVPTYAKYLKDSLNQKRQWPEMDKLLLVEGCSAAILDGLPTKMGDGGIPTISHLIGTQGFDQALCDPGVSVSVMPKVIYDWLSHDSLVPTSMHLQLDDQSICCLVVIVKDVPVRIMNSFIPVDFMVLEMDVCCQTSLIIGKSFLSTAEATIDVAAEIIKLNINRKEETFTFKPKRIEYCNQIRLSTGSTEGMPRHLERSLT